MRSHYNSGSLGVMIFTGIMLLAGNASWAAEPETIQAAEAYIDSDPGQGSGTALIILPGSSDMVIQIGTGNINTPAIGGPHVLGLRFQNNLGIWSDPVRVGFPIYSSTALDNNNVKEMEAFVDSDPGQGLGEPFGGIADDSLIENTPVIPLDISGLVGDGHVLSIRAQDSGDEWSEPVKIGFPVYTGVDPVSNKLKAMEAFVDNDPGQGLAQAFINIDDNSPVETPPVINLDVSGLSAGGHVLTVRAQDSGDQWSDTIGIGFPVYQPPVPNINVISAMEGFIGFPPPSPGSGSAFSGVFGSVVKADTGYVSILGLAQGVHPYGARAQDINGEWSGIVTMKFEFIDTDGDGLPDAYEEANGLDINDPTDAEGDPDGDKFTNLDEYIFGTDPDNIFSTPTPDPSCSSGADDVILTTDFTPGQYLCIGNSSISNGTAINIWGGAYLYLRAPVVELKQDARVEDGAIVRIRTMDLIPE